MIAALGNRSNRRLVYIG